MRLYTTKAAAELQAKKLFGSLMQPHRDVEPIISDTTGCILGWGVRPHTSVDAAALVATKDATLVATRKDTRKAS